jgi:SAM-dependent methyltransferase
MTEANMTEDLIRWKTDAWKSESMVAWYAGRMVDCSGTNRLKNRLEMDIIGCHVRGEDVLDVGIGTGRAALPLARRGLRVTGVDSSQAMLDETRRQAGDTPLTLLAGDVTQLPVPTASFDCLVSLNVIVHFPHWREVLAEWQRVIRPGGRIIFDIHSLDHIEAVYGACAESSAKAGQDATNFATYMSMARVEDIVAFADQRGMRLAGIVPLGAFLGGGAINHWLRQELEEKYWWKRLLGWMSSDDYLLELGAIIEECIVSNLTSRATCRYMVVLDNEPDAQANRQWLERNRARNELLSGRIEATALGQLFPMELFCKRMEQRGVLAHTRSRVFLYWLLRRLEEKKPGSEFRSILPPDFVATYIDWRRRDEIDAQAMRIIDAWPGTHAFAAMLQTQGVALAPGLEYGLMEPLLRDYFRVIRGVRS